MADSSREDQMLQAAQLYYLEGLTQSKIGEIIGVTRWTVGRLLEEARETGMVTITINHPRSLTQKLESRLVSELGIDQAIVVSSNDHSNRAVPRAAAKYLTNLEVTPSSIAVSWGRTMNEVARALTNNWAPGVHVYQTHGGTTHMDDNGVGISIPMIADKGPGYAHVLPAPAMVGNAEVAAHLLEEPSIVAVLRAAATSDITMFSPGVVSENSVLIQAGYLKPEHIELFRNHGAVGEIMGHFINSKGRLISADLDRRTVSMPLKSLRQSKRRVAVVEHVSKAPALRGAIAGDLVDVLITDATTATTLLELDH